MTAVAIQPWSPPQSLPRLSGTVAIDLETKDPQLKDRGAGWCFNDGEGYIVGVGLRWEGGKGYWPLRHQGGGNIDSPAGFLKWLKKELARTDITWIMHNRMYDEGWLRREGIPIKGTIYDTRTAAPLLNEYRRQYSLEALSAADLKRHKNLAKLEAAVGIHNAALKREALRLCSPGAERRAYLKERRWTAKGDLWQLPGDLVGEYGEDDADLTYELWQLYKSQLNAQDLWKVFELETRLLPILIEMRWRGVRVDLDAAERASKALMLRERDVVKQASALVGFPIDIWAAESLAKAFDKRGLPYNFTPKTNQPSFPKKWMADLQDPFADLINQARRYSKARTPFIDSYILQQHHNGRVYSEFLPMPVGEDGGAVTFRFSSKNPNLENLISPDKDLEMGVLVRGMFLPEQGMKWACIDYRQQEPRLFVHYSVIANVVGAKAAMKAYRDDPNMDFHTWMSGLTGLPRYPSKQIFLGKCYGMGGAKYCRSVNLPTEWVERENYKTGEKYMLEIAGEEGQRQLKVFEGKAPFVKGLGDECQRRAKRKGYIRTIVGHKLRFGFGKEDRYHKAVNKLIQGSAAGQLKKAMVDLWDAGEVPHVPVHDELDHSVEDHAHAKRIGEVMINAIQLHVPVAVDIEVGENWGATVKVKD